MKTEIRNSREVKAFVDGEKVAQSYMDKEYESIGAKVISRKSNRDWDLILEYKGVQYKTEEKFREGDWGDFLIEILQCMIAQQPGWFYETKAEIVIYAVCNSRWIPQKFYVINWQKFKDWFFQYLGENKNPKVIISPRGIGLTLNLAIRWADVPLDVCKFHLASCREAPWNRS